ncbi:MAG: hypothetical protein AAGJ81_06450 [Verrucomicrobiota bacterium]
MKNITVSVPDETYYRARVLAAERRTSLSAIVRETLNALSSERTKSEQLALEEQQIVDQIRIRGCTFTAADRLSREEAHDRNALR